MTIALKLADYDFHRVFTDEAIREFFPALPPSARGDFAAFIALPENRKTIVHAIASAAAQTFTGEELQALVDFNSSAVGQSINRKMLPYTRASIIALNREITPLLDTFMKSRK